MWKGVLILVAVVFLTIKFSAMFLMPWLEQFDPRVVFGVGYVFVGFVTVALRCLVSVVWPEGYWNDKPWETVVGRLKLYFGGMACLFSIPVLAGLGYCLDWAMIGEPCVFTMVGGLAGCFFTIGHGCTFMSWVVDDWDARSV